MPDPVLGTRSYVFVKCQIRYWVPGHLGIFLYRIQVLLSVLFWSRVGYRIFVGIYLYLIRYQVPNHVSILFNRSVVGCQILFSPLDPVLGT